MGEKGSKTDAMRRAREEAAKRRETSGPVDVSGMSKADRLRAAREATVAVDGDTVVKDRAGRGTRPATDAEKRAARAKKRRERAKAAEQSAGTGRGIR